MKSFVHFFVGILAVVAISACGKSNTEKAKDNVQSASAELEASAKEIQSMGAPSALWSDEKLNRFEALLNSCDSSANRIEAQNGKDGVTILDIGSLPNLRAALAGLRRVHSTARAEKADNEKTAKRRVAIEAAKAKYNRHVAAIEKAGTPTLAWSTIQLDEFDAELDGIETTAEEISAFPGEGARESFKFYEAAKEYRRLIQDIRKVKGLKAAA